MSSTQKNIASTGTLTINLSALVANWHMLNDKLRLSKKTTGCGAVVKANAYGLGIEKVGIALSEAGCPRFFVATLSEGIELRRAVGNKPEIIILSGISHGLGNDWLTYHLLPVLFDLSHVSLWHDFCNQSDTLLPYALKIDTGMHRIGISPKEFRTICVRDSLAWQEPKIIMSHLACADDPSHTLNAHQLHTFSECVSLAKKHYPNALYSLANSSGLFLGDEYYFDVGRPGVALYGVNPTPNKSNPMTPVVQLQLPIMQIKTIAAGESAGYSGSFIAERPTRLAIAFGGYADGLLRSLSHSGFAYCAGQKVPVAGKVSMDSMIFDITDISHTEHSPSIIDLIGPEQSIDDLANAANTIAYELLTSLGARFHRDYY